MLHQPIQTTKLNQISQKKYHLNQTWNNNKTQYSFSEALNQNDYSFRKTMFLSWMDIEKTITFGRALGCFFDKKFIPSTFKLLFRDSIKTIKR